MYSTCTPDGLYTYTYTRGKYNTCTASVDFELYFNSQIGQIFKETRFFQIPQKCSIKNDESLVTSSYKSKVSLDRDVKLHYS